MSDNLRRYRAIRDALKQYYPGQPSGTVARHLTTLAALISAKQQARGIAARLEHIDGFPACATGREYSIIGLEVPNVQVQRGWG